MNSENWTWTVVELPDRGQHDAMPRSPWSSMNWVEASRIAIDLAVVGGTGYPPIPRDLPSPVEDAVRSLLHWPIQVDRLHDLHTTERLLAMRCQGVTRTLGTRLRTE